MNLNQLLTGCNEGFSKMVTQTYNYTDEVTKVEQQWALTLRRLMSYIYGAPILDVSRSHTTTQHSR